MTLVLEIGVMSHSRTKVVKYKENNKQSRKQIKFWIRLFPNKYWESLDKTKEFSKIENLGCFYYLLGNYYKGFSDCELELKNSQNEDIDYMMSKFCISNCFKPTFKEKKREKQIYFELFQE